MLSISFAKLFIAHKLIDEAVAVYGEDHIYESFSGGKDSTVLSHIVRERYPNILHIFSDTTCEYPATIDFVKELAEAGANIVTVNSAK